MFDLPQPDLGPYAAQGRAPGLGRTGDAGRAAGAGSGPEVAADGVGVGDPSAGDIPADEIGFAA
ncbi:MAG: hypothetical protein WCP28_09480, partial [Actinomycetes bacterium]